MSFKARGRCSHFTPSGSIAPSLAHYLLTLANAGLPNGVVVSAYPFVNADIAAAAAIAVSKLAAGTNGYLLQMVTGIPTWTVDTRIPSNPGGGQVAVTNIVYDTGSGQYVFSHA